MGVLICPICKSRLEQEERRFACKNGHSFDLAAAGYLHLLPSNRMRAKIPGDNKQMVQYSEAILEYLNQYMAN